MWPDDVRFQGGQIDLHDLIKVLFGRFQHLGIGDQKLAVRFCKLRDVRTIHQVEIGHHLLIKGEDRGRRPKFSPHIRNGAFTSRTDRLRAGTEVFDNLVRAALHGQQPTDVEDHVLGGRPPVQLPRQPDPNQFGVQHFPRQSRHDFPRVSAADADREHAQAAPVRCMRIGPDNQPTGERVVLQYDLMDDPGAGFPEPDPVLFGR